MRKLGPSSGQATIEYVLLMSVVITIGLGLVWRFNDAFKVYANIYFGEYLACLIEAGELPSLGNTGARPDTNAQRRQGSVCESEFHAFSLADGRPPAGFDESRLNSSSSSSSGSKNNSNKSRENLEKNSESRENKSASRENKPRESSNAPRGADGASSDAQRVSVDARSSSGSPISRNELNSGRTRDVPLNENESGLKGAKGSVAQEFGIGSNSKRRSENLGDQGRLRFVPMQKLEQDELGQRIVGGKIAASDEDVRTRGQRVPAGSNKKPDQEMTADGSMSLPDFIKYFLIAAIILALVLFLGGQAITVSKSQEKN